MYVENAVILKTSLGYDNHGVGTAYIFLELPGGSIQTFGGLNLTSSDELKMFIYGVISAVGFLIGRTCLGNTCA